MSDDVTAITRVVLEMARSADLGAGMAMVELFAADGVMDNGTRVLSGRAELADYLGGAQPPEGDTERTKHVITNVMVDVDIDGTTARATSYFQVVRTFGLGTWGRYEDTFTSVDGAWRITHRRVLTDGKAPKPTSAPSA